MNVNDLDKFVGKYVVIIDPDGEGGSGWVVKVDSLMEVTHTNENGPEKVEGRMVHFDYGMGFFVTHDTSIKEVEPPEGDTGLFNPDNSPLPFP